MTPARLRSLVIALALGLFYLLGMWRYPALTFRVVAFGFIVLACAFGAFYVANLLHARRVGRRMPASLHLLALFVVALLVKVAFGAAIPRAFNLPILALTILTGAWCYLLYLLETRPAVRE